MRHTSMPISIRKKGSRMLYALICYNSEAVVNAWGKEKDDAVMARHIGAMRQIAAKGRLGPVARLMQTSTATTLRPGRQTMVLDGPFAETKEQLLGFYMVDCSTLDEAIETARRLARANWQGGGSYEIRPVSIFRPGTAVT
jgi:hypothetical protein